MVGVGGGLVALQSLLTSEKGTSHFNFQSNEPFLKFLRQLIRNEVSWSKTEKKIIILMHCANIVLYLGSAAALPKVICFTEKENNFLHPLVFSARVHG